MYKKPKTKCFTFWLLILSNIHLLKFKYMKCFIQHIKKNFIKRRHKSKKEERSIFIMLHCDDHFKQIHMHTHTCIQQLLPSFVHKDKTRRSKKKNAELLPEKKETNKPFIYQEMCCIVNTNLLTILKFATGRDSSKKEENIKPKSFGESSSFMWHFVCICILQAVRFNSLCYPMDSISRVHHSIFFNIIIYLPSFLCLPFRIS